LLANKAIVLGYQVILSWLYTSGIHATTPRQCTLLSTSSNRLWAYSNAILLRTDVENTPAKISIVELLVLFVWMYAVSRDVMLGHVHIHTYKAMCVVRRTNEVHFVLLDLTHCLIHKLLHAARLQFVVHYISAYGTSVLAFTTV
jgi:hypothetical protein